ncbi:FliH/SctL family protein [Desulfosarcina variabilis]|uniref:FliH/SctL family protein n=1 Tax=Desulfosarcina variabilis TaxID=2300 RepID=UPI003AFAFBD9
MVEVEDILLKAKEKADEIIHDAKMESEKIKLQANKAYVLEKEKGYKEGLKKSQDKMASVINRTIINSDRYIHSIEDKITELVLGTVKKIIDGMDNREMISGLVKKSLNVMKNHKKIKLKISPIHLDYLNLKVDEIIISYPNIHEIEILADDRLDENQLILESPIGIVDASIETQLAAIKDAFSHCFNE